MSTVNYTLIAILFVSWVGLFTLKDATSSSERRVAALQEEIIAEQNAIRDLMTDWAVLNEPGYLQGLARTHLGLNPVGSHQIVRMASLPMAPLDFSPRASGPMMASNQGAMQFPSMPLRSARLDRIMAAEEFSHIPQPSIRPAIEGGTE